MSRDMPVAFRRASALAHVAVPGRFGADKGAPGVVLSTIHPVSLVAVIALKRKSKYVKDALGALRGAVVMWAGPDQYFVKGADVASLQNRLAGSASVIDQSHGRTVLRVEGPKARALLSKGTPVDLHPEQFAVGQSALTQMAHVGVHLTRVGADAYELSVFRGFSESFWEWLTEQSLEFGYQVN